MIRTRMNGGSSSLKDVADAWHKEAHKVQWSEYDEDAWSVAFAKRMQDEAISKGPPKPDPRNIHGH